MAGKRLAIAAALIMVGLVAWLLLSDASPSDEPTDRAVPSEASGTERSRPTASSRETREPDGRELSPSAAGVNEPSPLEAEEAEDVFRLADRPEIPRRRRWENMSPELRDRARTLVAGGRAQLDRIGTAGRTPRDDLAAVSAILQNYHLLVKPESGLPTGLHEEIVTTLRGFNAWGLPFIPDAHEQFDAEGRILDRWGTPLFFHAESSERVELRSAGPDTQFYTNDDVVYP